MSERDEECELTRLVPPDNDAQISIRTGEATPPVTPSICKVAATPSSPTSNKVSSSGGGSIHGTGPASQGSSRNKLPGPSLTPVGLPAGNTRFLYVSEKFSNLSRRPSLLSDASCRTPKDNKPANPCMTNMKKEATPGESSAPTAPPNTPSPSGWRNAPPNSPPSDISEYKNDLARISENSFLASEVSSQMTTKALASESENVSETRTSSETLQKLDKNGRNFGPFDSATGTLTFSPSVGTFGSSSALNWTEHLNYLRATRSGHTGLRSVGSSAFIKSFWGHKNQKPVQHHCFMSDITDVRQMEQALLQLLEDFHSGKLRAFAKDCSMEQMQGIREQQERLARLHFDLGAQQELYAPLSEEGLRANQENMHKLMGSLEQLSLSIEKLQLFSKDVSQ